MAYCARAWPSESGTGSYTSELPIARQTASVRSAASAAPRWAQAPQSAALMLPALVPSQMVGLSPRASSAGTSTESAPAWNARAPPPPGQHHRDPRPPAVPDHVRS